MKQYYLSVYTRFTFEDWYTSVGCVHFDQNFTIRHLKRDLRMPEFTWQVFKIIPFLTLALICWNPSCICMIQNLVVHHILYKWFLHKALMMFRVWVKLRVVDFAGPYFYACTSTEYTFHFYCRLYHIASPAEDFNTSTVRPCTYFS